jgi:hypothetical protein
MMWYTLLGIASIAGGEMMFGKEDKLGGDGGDP